MQMFLSILSYFFSNIEYLVPTVWVAFGCVVAWFLLSAKRSQEITMNEAEMLWKTHKQFNHCLAESFTEIKEKNKLIGYICECGHQQKQERPIINFRR